MRETMQFSQSVMAWRRASSSICIVKVVRLFEVDVWLEAAWRDHTV